MTKNLVNQKNMAKNSLNSQETYYEAYITPKSIKIDNIFLPSFSRFVPGLKHIKEVPRTDLEKNVQESYKMFKKLGFAVLKPEEITRDYTSFRVFEDTKGFMPYIKEQGVDSVFKNVFGSFLDVYLDTVRKNKLYKPDFSLNYAGFIEGGVCFANIPLNLRDVSFDKGFANSNLFFIYDAFSRLEYKQAVQVSDIFISRLGFFEARKMQKENKSFVCDFALRFFSEYANSFVKYKDVVNDLVKKHFKY